MKLVRCKVCGLILPEGKLGDRCPACGVPKTVFQPYTDPVAESRRRILKLRTHPVAVHFPVSFSVAIPIFGIVAFVFAGTASTVLSATKALGVLLPVVVLGAALLGLLEGKIRFRRIRNSQLLKKKIVYASALLAVSIPISILVWSDGTLPRMMTVLLGLVAVVFSVLLGLIGDILDNNAMPGQ